MAMTRRERLRRCYFHEELDRPGVYNRTGYPGNDPTYDRLKAYLAQYSELKLCWGTEFLQTPYEFSQSVQPHSADFELHRAILHTPKGDLEATYLSSLKGQPGLHQTYFLKTREDAEIYLSLPMPSTGGDVSEFFKADDKMGDSGIVDVSLGSNPGGSVVELFGQETFAMMSISDRDIIHALLERQMEIVLGRAKYLVSQKVGPFFSLSGEEYIVPPMHSPQDFRDFNVKYDKPIFDVIHEAGGRVHIHCHASVKRVIKDFVDMGTDVLHPFEAPPMGDITPREAKKAARGKMCLEGNIQIARMYESSPDAIRAETEALIKDTFADHRGLIVCPTASSYIRGQGKKCFEQYKAMVETVIAHSR